MTTAMKFFRADLKLIQKRLQEELPFESLRYTQKLTPCFESDGMLYWTDSKQRINPEYLQGLKRQALL